MTGTPTTSRRKRLREALWAAQGGACRWCGASTELPEPGLRWPAAHTAVLSRADRDGPHAKGNACVSCFACNESRRGRR